MHTNSSKVRPFKALRGDFQKEGWVLRNESKSPNTRERMANYSKWPQEPEEEDFKIRCSFWCQEAFGGPQQKVVFRVEDQGS